jgi:hypothetical protein
VSFGFGVIKWGNTSKYKFLDYPLGGIIFVTKSTAVLAEDFS